VWESLLFSSGRKGSKAAVAVLQHFERSVATLLLQSAQGGCASLSFSLCSRFIWVGKYACCRHNPIVVLFEVL
jgi:hypothetical protein